MTVSKKMKAIEEKFDRNKTYGLLDAIQLLKSLPAAKFVETFECVFNLNVDPRKADQNIRGSVVLPHGTGGTKKVAVFTQDDDKIKEAKAAGADWVGADVLTDMIKKGKIEFDILIATPDAMRLIGPLGQILGPKGLMPNPKDGTVTADIKQAVNNAKKGQVKFRTDKSGIVHCSLGKINFDESKLKENFMAMLAEIRRLKTASCKGQYIKKISLSTTMGPGISIDLGSVS